MCRYMSINQIGDYNNDLFVNLHDLNILKEGWLSNTYDINDLTILLTNWEKSFDLNTNNISLTEPQSSLSSTTVKSASKEFVLVGFGQHNSSTVNPKTIDVFTHNDSTNKFYKHKQMTFTELSITNLSDKEAAINLTYNDDISYGLFWLGRGDNSNIQSSVTCFKCSNGDVNFQNIISSTQTLGDDRYNTAVTKITRSDGQELALFSGGINDTSFGTSSGDVDIFTCNDTSVNYEGRITLNVPRRDHGSTWLRSANGSKYVLFAGGRNAFHQNNATSTEFLFDAELWSFNESNNQFSYVNSISFLDNKTWKTYTGLKYYKFDNNMVTLVSPTNDSYAIFHGRSEGGRDSSHSRYGYTDYFIFKCNDDGVYYEKDISVWDGGGTENPNINTATGQRSFTTVSSFKGTDGLDYAIFSGCVKRLTALYGFNTRQTNESDILFCNDDGVFYHKRVEYDTTARNYSTSSTYADKYVFISGGEIYHAGGIHDAVSHVDVFTAKSDRFL